MLTTTRPARTLHRDTRLFNDGEMRGDLKASVIVVLLWLVVCGLAGLS
jgi:hypothetical protein